MAISIGDALLKIGVDKKDFDAGMASIGDTIKKHQKAIGLGMVAMGAAIVGGLAMAMKAAAEEEAGIESLRQTMANLGMSYDDNKESLEALINTQQQKTAIADSDQREALGQLLLITGNYTESLDLLNIAMDMAVGTGTDVTSVTKTLGYAYAGNWGMVNRMLPAIAKLKTEEEKWMFLREKFAGQAETYGKTMAGQMQLLKNNIGDVGEAIGGVLIPMVKSLFDKIMPIIEGIKEWTAAHPGLTRTIVIVTGALGSLAIAMGATLLILPKLIAGWGILAGIKWSTIIPAIWAHVTALWAQVTATLAAMAATGALIPAAILAVGAITALALGITQLAKQQKHDAGVTDELTRATGEGTEAWDVSTEAIDKNTEALDKQAESAQTVIERIKELTGVTGAGGYTEEQWAYMLKLAKAEPGLLPGYEKFQPLKSLQYGGIISEPTLLSSLQTMRPYAIAGETRPERVSPISGGQQMMTLILEQDGKQIARQVMPYVVGEIRLKTGVRV